jgi:hypothetical protein
VSMQWCLTNLIHTCKYLKLHPLGLAFKMCEINS